MKLLAVTALLLAAAAPAQLRLLQADDLPARRSAAAVLQFGLQSYAADPDAEGSRRLRAALATAAECLSLGSAARITIDDLRHRHEPLRNLTTAIAELGADLVFTPTAEADLPTGVPGFSVIEEVELRSYPTYRMVRTNMKGGAFAAFWPLFRHIQSESIAMTTPVQIDYREASEQPRQQSMAFLYGSTALGNLGKNGNIEVVDVPRTTVLTIGSRGYDRPSRIEELRARLDSWLAVNPQWQAAGPMRLLGYNSPTMPEAKRGFEVQLPVRRAVVPQPRESV